MVKVLIDGKEVDTREQMRMLDRIECEESLYVFLQYAWPIIDSAPFMPGWCMEAVCEHLEAVAHGQIKRLVINIPPRCAKSSIVSVAFPAWVWAQPHIGPTCGPGVQFLCASYAQQLTLRDSVRSRRLVGSPWYTSLWGDRFTLNSDQNTKSRFGNNQSGERLITSVGAAVTGEGGDIIIIDDPNAAQEAFSEANIEATVEWWDGAMSTRLNDPRTGAYIIIQQRLAEDDLTGHVLSKDRGDWTHLILPMKYEWDRHCVTRIGWEDPRGIDSYGNSLVVVDETGMRYPRDQYAYDVLQHEREGTLLWPERFGEDEVKSLEVALGPFKAAGQLQQRPEPKGGGIIKREWWQPWSATNSEGKLRYPDTIDFVLASLDTAYTEKSENDYSALTVWGVFARPVNPNHNQIVDPYNRVAKRDGELVQVSEDMMWRESGNRTCGIFMMYAWQERLELHNLVKKVAETCKTLKVDRLIIESKAAGHSVAQEIRRLYQDASFGVQLIDPKGGDKMARLYSIQHIFAEKLIYAPEKVWAEEVITQCGQFPNGKHDDLVDTVSMALRHLRDIGLLTRQEEVLNEIENKLRTGPSNGRPLYDV